MLGIGLGGFMDGFKKAQDMKLDREKADLLKKRTERQEVLDARDDAAYERSETQRVAIEDTVKNSQAEFDAAVAGGQAKPEDSDDWFSKYTAQKLKNTYLSNGDIDNADRVQKWADTANARTGAKLFKSALFKAQNGDGGGALDDAIKAGQTQGYIAHGYEVKKHDKIVTPDGGVVGYRIWLTDPDGKEVQQDIQASELPKTIATFLNPDAAWESQIAASQAETKRQQDLEDYRTKKEIDKSVGLGDDKLRGDAITSLRKRLDGGLAGDEAKFDDLPGDQKEKLIAEELTLQRGGSAPAAGGVAPGVGGATAQPTSGSASQPVSRSTAQAASVDQPAAQQQPAGGSSRKVLVDKVTGQKVETRPQQGPNKPKEEDARAPGLLDRIGQGVVREVNILAGREEAPTRARGEEAAPTRTEAKQRTRKSDGMRREENVAYQVSSADAAVREGMPIDRVVQELMANGVPERLWPEAVKLAIQKSAGGGVIGLGG